jgi:mannosyltransferase OCH1-like enzyme
MNFFIISLILILIILLVFFVYIKYTNRSVRSIIDYYRFKRESYIDNKYTKKNIEKYVKKFAPKTKEKYLFQTYVNKSKIPRDIYYNIKKYAPNYKHLIYDDNDIEIFLKEHFNKNVLDTFNSLKEGAHKADLARYCLLYIYMEDYIWI